MTYLGFLLLVFAAQINAKPCWYTDSNGFAEHAGCIESRGRELRIRKSHLDRLRFSGNMAAAYNSEYGWMYVNSKGIVIVAGVISVDNGPDEFRDGFVRYEKNGRCGYASSGQAGSIAPRFDGCMPFEKGKARVCVGCRREAVDNSGEYHELRGGEWFCVDTGGNQVPCN